MQLCKPLAYAFPRGAAVVMNTCTRHQSALHARIREPDTLTDVNQISDGGYAERGAISGIACASVHRFVHRSRDVDFHLRVTARHVCVKQLEHPARLPLEHVGGPSGSE
jgi:hypothetical protein